MKVEQTHLVLETIKNGMETFVELRKVYQCIDDSQISRAGSVSYVFFIERQRSSGAGIEKITKEQFLKMEKDLLDFLNEDLK